MIFIYLFINYYHILYTDMYDVMNTVQVRYTKMTYHNRLHMYVPSSSYPNLR